MLEIINQKNQDNLPDKPASKLKTIFKLSLLGFLALAILLAAVYFIKKEVPGFGNVNQNDNKKFYPPPYIPQEAPIIYSRSGKITAIKSNYLIVESQIRTTSNDPAFAFAAKSLTVYLTGETVYTKKDYQNFNQDLVSPPVQPSNFNELKKGDVINIKSIVNIKNLDSFTASEIELIY